MITKDEFFKKGFYVGKTEEIVDSQENFITNCNKVKDLSKDKKLYKYRFDVRLPIQDEFKHLKLPYENTFNLSEEQIKETQDFVDEHKDIVNIFQRWWSSTIDFENALDGPRTYFRKLVEKFIIDIYPELKDNIVHHDNFSLYENGDFIQPHRDGQNEGRKCVVLIYLSHKEDYNDGGGELVIHENDYNDRVLPTNDNFVVLDFTQNNPNHAVEVVKNDFQRLLYINFVYYKFNKK